MLLIIFEAKSRVITASCEIFEGNSYNYFVCYPKEGVFSLILLRRFQLNPISGDFYEKLSGKFYFGSPF
jgi:hypothetical protein